MTDRRTTRAEIAAQFPEGPLHPAGEPRLESRAQHRRGGSERRSARLHRLRLHGGSRLALLFDRHAAERRLRRRRRAERFAAGGKLDPSLRRCGARRPEPRAAHRYSRGTHSRVVTWPSIVGRSKTSAVSTPEYHKAGDDVDFCWRLQQEGHVIAFSPTAIVWHHRRFTLRAFRKQQEGYGEAESMLRFKHLIFFGPTGTAKWRGQIYGTPRFSWFINRDRSFITEFSAKAFSSRSIPRRNRKSRLT